MRYKLAIFDLDGTVLNTIGGLTHAVNAALAMNGLPGKTRDEVQAMIGNGTRKLIERALSEVPDGILLIEKVYADYNKFYVENCSYDTYPYETHGNVPEVPVKPDPTFVYETMKNLGVKPSEAVYIGDSDVDIRTGKNAGIDYISVDWGFRTREFLLANGAERIFSKPCELGEYLICQQP